jgi:peptidoglycan/LPS O-acetylase OafA/YrhL
MNTAVRPSTEAAETLRSAVHQKNIPGLDAMRATAILMVVLFHWKYPVSGALGVIVFFVLSGFLITGVLIKELKKSGTISIGNFYRRRAFRIFPAFYVCWFVTIGLSLRAHDAISWKHAFESFFYLADYGRAFLPLKDQINYPLGVTWSLAVEEQFYLLWPLALLWVSKLKRPALAVAWIIAGLWMWRALLVVGFHVSWDYAYNAFDTRADALMIGCWLALIVYRGNVAKPVLLWVSQKWLVLVPLVGLVGMSTLESRGLIGTSAQVAEFTIAPVLTAILLLQWMYWGLTDWAFLEHWSIKFMARISYSLYLYHGLVKWQLPDLGRLHHGKTALTAILCMLAASASYYGIERPFMKMRDRGHRASVLLDNDRAPH